MLRQGRAVVDVQGDIRASTTCGDISVADALAKIQCATTDGNVTISAKPGHWKGENVDVRTTSGDIRVQLPVQREQ